MKPVMKIKNVVLKNEVEGDVFTLHIYNKDGTMSYPLEEALSDETYVIYYDRKGKGGEIKDLNIKFPETFGWGIHSAEELKERAVRIFRENF